MYKLYAERDAKIVAYVLEHSRQKSHQLIADHFGVTRGVISGVMFRHHHPKSTRIASLGYPGRNMIGTGRRPPPYLPRQNARSAR